MRHCCVVWASWWLPGRCWRRSSGRSCRIWMSGSGGWRWAAEARMLGHGGIRLVARAAPAPGGHRVAGGGRAGGRRAEPLGRVRRPGGGRKRAADIDPGLVPALLALVEPEERGDPMSPLRWTTKSTRTLAGELTRQGHQVVGGHGRGPAAGRGVQPAGQRQDHRGTPAPGPGRPVPLHQRARPRAFQDAGEPVISVDAKKKELVGEFGNAGPPVAARGPPGRGPRPRLRLRGRGEGHPVRDL